MITAELNLFDGAITSIFLWSFQEFILTNRVYFFQSIRTCLLLQLFLRFPHIGSRKQKKNISFLYADSCYGTEQSNYLTY